LQNNSGYTIKSLPEDERPREKLIKHGVESLSNVELLAIILKTGTKDSSALELSKKLLSEHKSGISALVDISVEELKKIKGIGPSKASGIIAAVELGRRVSVSEEIRYRISSPTDVSNYLMRELGDLKKEHFNIVMLDNKNYIIEVHNVSVGSLNSAIVHPREVFKNAIRRSSASIILAHNHPSGKSSPSAEDISITKRLVECGEIIGIKVLDHIIVGRNEYFSFKEQSII
jgi:DNA repair protein RadC